MNGTFTGFIRTTTMFFYLIQTQTRPNGLAVCQWLTTDDDEDDEGTVFFLKPAFSEPNPKPWAATAGPSSGLDFFRYQGSQPQAL